MMKARLGVFGGTFDPVHCGHVAVARRALEHGLDRIVVVPARISPHKLPASGAHRPAPARHRWKMLELAFSNEPRVELSRIDIDRPGVSYTRDTLARLRQSHPGAELVLLVGADQLPSLDRWAGFTEWAPTVAFLVFHRKGFAPDAAAHRLQGLRFECILDFDVPASATDIRARLARSEPVARLLPPAVEGYIRQHRLYGARAA